MTIEALLTEQNALLKELLTAVQSGAQLGAAVVAEAKTASRGKGKSKGDNEPATTVYWASDSLRMVFEQKPGEAGPQGDTFTQVSAEDYQAKKAVFEKNEQSAATNQVTAQPESSAQAAQGSASASNTSAAAGTATWADALAALMSLVNPKHMEKHGQTAVKEIMNQFKPDAVKAKDLEPLGKHAEIIEAVKQRLNPPAAAAADSMFD